MLRKGKAKKLSKKKNRHKQQELKRKLKSIKHNRFFFPAVVLFGVTAICGVCIVIMLSGEMSISLPSKEEEPDQVTEINVKNYTGIKYIDHSWLYRIDRKHDILE